MASIDQSSLLEIYLIEYEKLKDEQIQRIGFRDNLIYATLVALGGVLSFALSDTANLEVLLVLPVACVILGWTYLVNDEKISLLGDYIRTELSDALHGVAQSPTDHLFRWEFVHRNSSRRRWHKAIQLLIDELTFTGSGLVGLFIYWQRSTLLPASNFAANQWIVIVEIVILSVLGWEILTATLPKQDRLEGKNP